MIEGYTAYRKNGNLTQGTVTKKNIKTLRNSITSKSIVPIVIINSTYCKNKSNVKEKVNINIKEMVVVNTHTVVYCVCETTTTNNLFIFNFGGDRH